MEKFATVFINFIVSIDKSFLQLLENLMLKDALDLMSTNVMFLLFWALKILFHVYSEFLVNLYKVQTIVYKYKLIQHK